MTNDLWRRNEIASPCVNICVIHADAGICVGCYRSLAEIGDWSRMSADERQEIMAALPARAALLTRRRGGRAAKLADRSDGGS